MNHPTATDLLNRMNSGELTSRQLLEQCLADIDKRDDELFCFTSVDRDGALARADEIDRRRAAGDTMGPLAGVPVAVKDNIATRDWPTTCSSQILKDWRPPYNAHVVDLLEAADAVILGKTNLDEFAMGSSCENSGFRPTLNPHNTERVAGGSSGGSAAAVAAGLVPLALGSDTGGSIRQPASLCGVMGLKPTYGLVSRYGLVAFGSSLDQIGPMARSADDLALLMNVITGHDRRDSTSLEREYPDYTRKSQVDLSGKTVGLPTEYFGQGLDEQVEAAVRRAIRGFEQAGATVVDVSLPHSRYALSCYYIVATAEASSNLARYDGVHYGHRTDKQGSLIDLYSRSRAEGFGPEVKRRIMLGTYVLSAGYVEAYYKKALKVRELIARDFREAFKKVDILAGPTSPTVAWPRGVKVDDPLSMYLSDVYTLSVNLAGVPGVSVPCGVNDEGLPIGLQLIGDNFSEPMLLGFARAVEQSAE